MGLGAAMVFPATLSLIYERLRRARASGPGDRPVGRDRRLAIALGPIVGGWLLEHFSWSSIFFAMAPVAALARRCSSRCTVPTSRDPRAPRLDRPGLVLSTAGDGGC